MIKAIKSFFLRVKYISGIVMQMIRSKPPSVPIFKKFDSPTYTENPNELPYDLIPKPTIYGKYIRSHTFIRYYMRRHKKKELAVELL